MEEQEMQSVVHRQNDIEKPYQAGSESIITFTEDDDEEAESIPFIKREEIKSTKSESVEFQEPLTHVKNKTIVEKCFGICLNDRRSHLTQKELRAFYSLKSELNVAFDSTKESHLKIIRSLWEALFKIPMGDEISNPRWQEVGFQNIDPRSDFRGAGVSGLRMLTSYTQNNPQLVALMTDPKDDYLFAISSINVTHHLMKYFHLLNKLVYELNKTEICSRKALKNFNVFLLNDRDVFSKFHDLLFSDLYGIWVYLKKKKAGVTIMDFGVCLQEMRRKLEIAINRKFYINFDEFRLQYGNLLNWNGRVPVY